MSGFNLSHQVQSLRGISVIRNAISDHDTGITEKDMNREKSLDEDEQYRITGNGSIEIKDDYIHDFAYRIEQAARWKKPTSKGFCLKLL